MREAIGKIISLGLGVAIVSKEQIEKTVEELVKKGEINKAESSGLVDDLIKKGEESKNRLEAMVKERVNAILGESRLATKEDIARIEQRLDALERKGTSED
ncbi:phasin family protein [Paenibacillus spongiae]|uniref:Polyhydroxyalkanoate synthesis regulator n=1 Tax=Paenibacillus spongiae TaxID=2909671 RepID=A0ABY5SCF8_9BACL|nr:hypothetical protein [Paenibacillus spongiae]UVI30447.1 hypothetical protein L1F29_00715 [Paenibacillus spongiae]